MNLKKQFGKYCGLLLIAISSIISYGCSNDSDEVSQPGSIYGLVTDAKTAEPIRSAGVELYKYDTEALLLKTVTFDDGHFEFQDLRPGEYVIALVAEGYYNDAFYVEVEPARVARADMQLEKMETNMTVATIKADAKSNGTVSLYGYETYHYSGYNSKERGFIYGQNSNLTAENGTTVKAQSVPKTDGYNMTAEVKGLQKGKWYVKAYAKNKVGTAFGEIISFEVSGSPEVATLDVQNITESTATFNGRIIFDGDPKYTEKGFVYSSSFPNPTVDDAASATSKVIVTGSSKEFSANISNLKKDKTYYVRAYAKGSSETVYGATVSFVATSFVPYVIIDNIAVQLSDLSHGTDHSSAKDICSQSRVGGFSDWRLPTIGELSLIYANKDKIKGFAEAYYWSSTIYGSTSYYALTFETGRTEYWTYKSSLRVRAVRTIK